MSDEKHEQRLNMMKFKIIQEEKKNLTLQRSDSEMVEKIRKIIIDEAKKFHGGKGNVD